MTLATRATTRNRLVCCGTVLLALVLAGCSGVMTDAAGTTAVSAVDVSTVTAPVATPVAPSETMPAATTQAPASATMTAEPPPLPSATPILIATQPPTYTFSIVNSYPHDTSAFTEGLVIDNGRLYEGTGRWGESDLREVDLESGAVVRSQPLDDQYFGEGVTILGDRIYQVTWQEHTGFVYDKATFAPLQTFSYPHEGWGLTHDGSRLIVSDGTATIRFWDPETLQEIGSITVRDHRGPVTMLNELEYVDGEIWANVWLTDLIARISPETGDVLGYIDLTGLLDTNELSQPVDVLNGIARDPDSGRLYVTGKLWPLMFEIKIVPTS